MDVNRPMADQDVIEHGNRHEHERGARTARRYERVHFGTRRYRSPSQFRSSTISRVVR